MDSLNVPKKRGRKAKVKPEQSEDNEKKEVKVLKKRGRKPKNVVIMENEEEIKVPKKRGRKPKKKVYSVIKMDNSSTINNNENIILHLPIKSDESEDTNNNNLLNDNTNQNLFEYNPEIPPIPLPYNNLNKETYKSIKNDELETTEPTLGKNDSQFGANDSQFGANDSQFGANDSLIETNDSQFNSNISLEQINSKFEQNNDMFSNNENNFNQSENVTNTCIPYNKDLQENDMFLNNNEESYKKISNSMGQLYDNTKNKSWPVSTTIACWWCCHNFDTSPVGIPTSLDDNTFNVYGCFCSYNCAMSHIFSNNNNSNNSWEEFTLLKLLYKKMNNTNAELKCAPPKEVLELFGGTVNINDYRNSFKVNNISYRYITPPIISIISQIIEEKKNINQKNTSENKNVLQVSNTFRLQRSKPLVSSKNSLEATMGIKIK